MKTLQIVTFVIFSLVAAAQQNNYHAVYDYVGGIAQVRHFNRYGAIDQSGKVVIPVHYSSATIKPVFEAELIRRNPNNAEIYYLFGDKSLRDNNDSVAIINYQKALALSPQTAETYLTFGDKMKILNKDSLAGVCYQKALALSPQTAETYLTFGDKMKNLYKDSLAGVYYQKAYQLDSSNVDVCLKVAKFQYKNFSQSEAVPYARRALQLNPKADISFLGFTKSVNKIQNKEKKYGLIDSTLRMITTNWYEEVKPFNITISAVKDTSGWFFVNSNGKKISSYYIYTWCSEKNIYPAAQISEKEWIYINLNGQPLNDKKYSTMEVFAEGLGRVLDKDGKSGYINTEGKEVIPCQYEDAKQFANGKAKVKLETGDYFYIDKTGKKVE